MKKASIILASAMVLGTLLAGCGNNNNNAANNAAATNAPAESAAPATNAGNAAATAETGKYQDGTYYGTADADAETGWQSFVILTVEGGKITNVDWDGFNTKTAGDLKKKFSEDGKYGMKAGGASAEWHEEANAAAAYLVEKQDPDAITLTDDGHTDAVSGVSIHVADLVTASKAALAAGPTQLGPYKDGGYFAEGEMDAESGWKSTVAITVAGGNVVAANFSGVNAAGDDKKQYSIDGKYGMKAGGASAEWHEEIALAEKYFLENKGAAPALKDDGTTDAISGVSIHVGEYFSLAEKALEGAK
ncbi:FMN-binding protein [Paenibacillus sp. NFR01]|uniref:FMN-binding protein n=1 Tax=Paenibacillus sp. NFR01 TaxID=1566279 RepID=UPI0008ADE98A|nr:FMN-binding protein [Paenibacillus sp. NFR01]SEU29841.1 Major membrane immunogen, membrane-anchored lipoprotein [Paenibacillus sp. NFR01]